MDSDSKHPPHGPELVIGLVGAVGTDLDLVSTVLQSALSEVGYTSGRIHVIELVHEVDRWRSLPETPLDARLDAHMNAGGEFREAVGRGDALALLAIGAIREERANATNDVNAPIPRHAYVLRSLKHPEEVLTLRRIYGPSFVLLAAYAPRELRRRNLAKDVAGSRHAFHTEDYFVEADQLIQRDEAEVGKKLGQNVRKTFPLADVFINTSDPDGLQREIERFVELLFGYPFHTPTRDEYGMFHAQAAALRSASLSRQVGAVISTADGNIIAVGTNEVPRAGGGLYWSGDCPDHRDFRLGYDTGDEFKKKLLGDILQRLRETGWLVPEKGGKGINELVEEALAGEPSPLMAGAEFMNLIEFFRAVHAEMAALADAARRGVSVEAGVLHTTTFPCHDCAKHIVAAGIKRVVYIEPYPKSLVPELYPDSISVDSPRRVVDQVSFEPFVGVAPRRYMDLFAMDKRKRQDGRVSLWAKSEALPRLGEAEPSHLARLVGEESEFTRFKTQMAACGLLQITKEAGSA